nr:MAG TPA: Tudor domain-containing protein 5 genomics consortium, SGC, TRANSCRIPTION.28A [Caudoviricetes sp.]
MPSKDNELEEIKSRLSSVIIESELSYRELGGCQYAK